MANNAITNILNAAELRKRLLFVFGALAVFRVAAAIPIPGINTEVLKQLFQAHQNGRGLGAFFHVGTGYHAVY